MRLINAVKIACVLTIAQPALACNHELELPYDFGDMDTVLIGRITNYRIVPNTAEADRIKSAIANGTARDWEKRRYADSTAKGLPITDDYGLFDVVVIETLKGQADRRMTVIYPNIQACCFGPNAPRMLPVAFPNQVAMIALRSRATSSDYFGRTSRQLVVEPCTGSMIIRKNSGWFEETRKYLRSLRKK